MEREANYAAVGAFVLLVLALAGYFVYWYSDASEHRDFKRYEIYFEGSVSGLSRGSTVRYLGVDIGRVVDMRVDPRDPTRVQVLADIDSTAPIAENTVAELSLQGVTGLLYIDLLGDRGSKPLSREVPSQQYPVIRSVRSGFELFVANLPEVMAKAGEVAQRLTLVLSDENVQALSSIVSNVDKASRTLPATMQTVDELVRELRGAAREMQAVAANVRTVTDGAGPQLSGAVERVRMVADNLASTTLRLDQFLADSQQDVRAFTREGLPEFERLMRDGREAAFEFRELSRSLRNDPSQLIYQPRVGGVEIPR